MRRRPPQRSTTPTPPGDTGRAPISIGASGLRVALGGTEILHGIDLTVGGGEWVSIIGPNGAGKTTALRALAGLVRYEGRVDLGGRDLASLHRTERSRAIALVPQNPVVPAALRVIDYVLLGRNPHLRMLASEGPRDRAVARDVLAELELGTMADRALDTLSGGERQRAIIARALVQESPVLLLDEPTTSLDIGHQQEVLDLVETLHRDRSLTVVSTMHDLTLAGQYADRLVLLAEGEVVAAGPAPAVLTEEILTARYGARLRVVDTGDDLIVVARGRSRN